MAMAKFALLALALFCMKVATAQEVATDAAAVTVEPAMEEDDHRVLYPVNPCEYKPDNEACKFKPYVYGYCCKNKCQKKMCPTSPPPPPPPPPPPANPCKNQPDNEACEISPYKSGYCCKMKCQKKKCPIPNPCKAPGVVDGNTTCTIKPYVFGVCCRGKCVVDCPPLCGNKVCKAPYTCCTVDYKKVCVDLNKDVKNCGACGNVCANPYYPNKKFKCVYGVCKQLPYY